MDKEVECLLAAYDRTFEMFRLYNENHFKRTNFYMVAFQAALMVAVFNILSKIGTKDWRSIHWLLIGVASLLGMSASYVWLVFNKRQHNYLEFARFQLRDIEARLLQGGVPLKYFRDERIVFYYKNSVRADSVIEGKFPYSKDQSNWFFRIVGFHIATAPIKGGLRKLEQASGLALFALWTVLFISAIWRIACM